MIAHSILFSAIALLSTASAATCGLGLAGFPLNYDALPYGSGLCGGPVLGAGLCGGPVLGGCGGPILGGCGGPILGSGLCGSNFIGSGLCDGPLNSLIPRTISNTCTCTKTTVRPKITQVIKDVPTYRRVVQNIATPILEQQQYPALPTNLDAPCGCGINSAIGINNGYLGLNNGLLDINGGLLGLSGGCGCGCSNILAPLAAPCSSAVLPCGL